MSQANEDTQRFVKYLEERLAEEPDPEKRKAVEDMLKHFRGE